MNESMIRLWTLIVGANFIAITLLAFVFLKEEGRFRLYMAVFLFVCALETGVAFLTILLASPEFTVWFAVPRMAAQLIQAITAFACLGYLARLLNGKKKH